MSAADEMRAAASYLEHVSRTLRSMADRPAQFHSVDTCGWDFDALADITRLAGQATTPFECCALSEALIEWFHDQGLDIKKLGGNRES